MFNVEAVRALLIGIAALLIILVGIRIIAHSNRAQYGDVARTSMNAIVGIVFLAVGAGTFAVVAFGESILRFLGLGS